MSDLRKINEFHTDDPDRLSRELSAHEDSVDRSLDSAAKAAAQRMAPTSMRTAACVAKVGDFVMCAGTFPVTLPAASPANAGLCVDIVVTSGTVTVTATPPGLVQGAASEAITVPKFYKSSGVGWWRQG